MGKPCLLVTQWLVCAGLDARAAAIVIRAVKNTSRSGRTVIVTIHQPSLEIFEAFDALVLMQKGGKVIPSHLQIPLISAMESERVFALPARCWEHAQSTVRMR